MDESEASKTQMSYFASNIDINSNNNLLNFKNHNKNNSYSLQNINIKNIHEIYENIIFNLPPNCYKILYNYENNTTNKISFNNLEQYYIIKNIQIIKEWSFHNENIFKNLNKSKPKRRRL